MPLLTAKKIILASASPRRSMLLRQCGVEPELLPVDVTELRDAADPAALVAANSRLKAQAAYALRLGADALIVAADTVVAMDGLTLGKPCDAADAARMLRLLSGRTHSVFSGLCVINAKTGTTRHAVSETRVSFAPLSDDDIAAYVATGEPLDKAGAYAMQEAGGLFVTGINGDYSTVVGMSLPQLRALLREIEHER